MHLTKIEGIHTMQTTTSPRGSSRRNVNKDLEGAQRMRETTAAKAENKVMTGGMYHMVRTGRRVCVIVI